MPVSHGTNPNHLTRLVSLVGRLTRVVGLSTVVSIRFFARRFAPVDVPYINRTNGVRDDLDTLTSVRTVSVLARLLKAGMVLVDPKLDTPAAEIDHRTRAVRGSGEVAFLIFDYDARNWFSQSFHANTQIKVMAA